MKGRQEPQLVSEHYL